MSTWPKEGLDKIAAADDMHVAPCRDDGVAYGTPLVLDTPKEKHI